MAATLTIIVAACNGADPAPQADRSADPSAAAVMTEEPTMPDASGDLGVSLCVHIERVEQRLAGLTAIELRLPNRVALDIELGKLEAAFSELRQADLGELEDRLRSPLRRLGYRLDELKLAVEDFRTNPRPRRAAPHVEEDAGVVADSLASFGILARC